MKEETIITKLYNEEDIKCVQDKSLELILYFKDFCESQGLLFYLCGGGLIGAIRHGGFIPWDDDLDVFMPRRDYEILSKTWNEQADKKYELCRSNRQINYRDTGMTIKNRQTTFIEKHSQDLDINHGIGLEIMPIDGYAPTKLKRAKQFFFALVYGLFNGQRLPDNKGKLVRFLSRILLSIIKDPDIRYRIWSYSEKQMSKYSWDECLYVTELIGSFRGMVQKHPKEWFERAVYKDFEGHKLPVMAGYEQYLTRIFGDYMELPAPENRSPKHNTAMIDCYNSYEKYKGIYYLKD